MVRSPVADNAASIDQVIQSERPITMADGSSQTNRREVDSDGRNYRTRPMSPASPTSPNSRRRMERQPTPNASSNDQPPTRNRSFRQSDDGSSSERSGYAATSSRTTLGSGPKNVASANGTSIMDFFSSEVFSLVLHNPTTAHRLMRFCQSRACGENMEFLQKVEAYHRLLDEMTQLLGTIHSTYISPDAPRQINLSHHNIKRVAVEIREASQSTVPTLESVFAGAQDHVEKLIASDIYPRFVKHQVTASATMALANHRDRYAGLGDCFCMTCPSIADNPILYASDGFVQVTGYSRKDVIPRNCRFLQGELTDLAAPRRLKFAIENCEEIVELLLNYRKNGEPFWNLLYVSPLYNERGDVTFFLGGQINCSTTIHTFTDILKTLSVNDDELDLMDTMGMSRPPSIESVDARQRMKTKSSFFKSWRKYDGVSGNTARRVIVREEPGMEGELVNKLGKLTFKTQVEAFYTAYSKYIVMDYNSTKQTLLIQHYSPGIIDMLCLNLPNGNVVPIFNKEIFKVLQDYASSPSNSSRAKEFRNMVRDAVRVGRAVSFETGLLTGFAERRGGGGWFSRGEDKDRMMRVEETYVTHWTPLKDENGRVTHVVLAIAPKD